MSDCLITGSCCHEGCGIHGTCDPPSTLGHVIVCGDGETRHPGLFPDRAAALRWLARSHACQHSHAIRPVTAP